MKTLNRVDGVMKVMSGVGMMCGAVCLASLTPWVMVVAVPAWIWGGLKVGAGTAQAVTGWSEPD